MCVSELSNGVELQDMNQLDLARAWKLAESYTPADTDLLATYLRQALDRLVHLEVAEISRRCTTLDGPPDKPERDHTAE